MLPNEELRKIGYSIVIYPTASIFLMAKSMQQLMGHLKKNGSTAGMIKEMVSFQDFNELVGLDSAIEELEFLMGV